MTNQGLNTITRGEVLVSLSDKIPNPSLVEIVELLAARRAVMFVQKVGLGNSIFGGGFKTVINSVWNGDILQSTVVKDALSFVNS